MLFDELFDAKGIALADRPAIMEWIEVQDRAGLTTMTGDPEFVTHCQWAWLIISLEGLSAKASEFNTGATASIACVTAALSAFSEQEFAEFCLPWMNKLAIKTVMRLLGGGDDDMLAQLLKRLG